VDGSRVTAGYRFRSAVTDITIEVMGGVEECERGVLVLDCSED
jgi:hypothetical protein